MEHRFYTLDVFTSSRFEGNPLAVFTDGDSLSNDQMQAIAREMNLAETVFVQKPTDERALARLRIFTTQELKLAGHPVVGTWFLLAELGVVPAQEGGVHVMQETGAGVLPVEIRFKDGRPDRKSTRLNSSHVEISYAVFCLKKKKRLEMLNSSGGRPDYLCLTNRQAPRSALVPYTTLFRSGTEACRPPRCRDMVLACGARRCPGAGRRRARHAGNRRRCPARRNTFQGRPPRSEEHTSELQSRRDLVCRLLLEKKKTS